MRRRGRPSDEPAAEEPPPPADEPREKRPSKRHKPDPELAAPSPPAKKEGGKKDKKAAATVPAEDASADAKAVFLGLLDAVRAQVSPDGRLMAGIFEKLPSKKELPDYYVVIDNPIDLKTIQAKIAKDGYAGIKELKADMDLMFGNAKKYNMPGSDIYKDAVALQKFFNAQAAGVKVSGGASAGGDAPKEKTLKITLKRAESGTEEKPAGDKKRKDGKKEEVKEEKKEDDKKPAILRKKLSDKDIGIYFKALHDDDEAEVVRFLSPPINVNPGRLFQATLDRQMFKWTAMQAAAYYGSVKAIRALAKAGANVEQQDEWYGGRALAWACYGDHADVARVLMEELGADKNAQNNGGQVAWELVPNKGAEKWRGLMIDEKEWQKIRDEIIARDGTAEPKPPPNVPHPNALKSKTLLSEDALKMHEILKADDLERFKQFVTDYHLDVNANQTTRELGEAFKWGPLHAACYFGSAKCARFLLEKGAKVEQADLGFGSRPLAWAVYADKVEIAKMLVHEFGADKDARNGLDKRALDMAEDPQDPKWKEVFEDKTKLRIKFKMGEDDDDDMGASPAPVSAGAPGAYFPPGAQPGQPPRYGLPQAAGGQPPMPIKRPPGRPPSRPPAPYPGFQPGGGGYSPYPGTPGMPGAGTPYMQGPRPPNAFYPPGGYPPQPYNPYSAGAGFGPRPPAPGSLYPR
ncbi:ankyrin repeat-containing domain protein, partial [Hyaloraphidium curvatum]